MAAYKPERGTYEVDRIFPELGRVRIRTGTHDKRLADRYEAMLEALPLSTVRLILDKRISVRAAYDAWSSGQTRSLPTADTFRPLIATMRAWTAKPLQAVGEAETRHRKWVVDYLAAQAGDVAQVGGLAELLKAMRADYDDRGPSFNRARASCMAFLRDLVGSRHTLYDEVAAVPTLPEPPKFPRHPCTVAEAREHARALGDRWGPIWWSLCCHGFGPKEFWIDGWKVLSEGLEIFGRKNTTRRPSTARHRVVPLVVVPPTITGTSAGFAEALDRAGLGVTPYDARRSYARWLDDIGAPGYLQDAFMGHGPKSMRELYKWGDIRAWLETYTTKLRKYVGEKRGGLRVQRGGGK